MENKLYRCPYSKTDSVACDMQSPCIECKVYFPDTMDKIFTSHNTASAPCSKINVCDLRWKGCCCRGVPECYEARRTLP